MPAKKDLFTPIDIGPYTLKNRIFMAPMTRCRADDGNVPTEMMALYYAQRASAGLIITEATQVSPQGIGYPSTPGIHSEAQVNGWQKVTESVHRNGGRIFLQLWHVGRVSHPDFLGGELPVAPSAIAPAGKVYTHEGPKPYVVPRPLATDEITEVAAQYRSGAENALAAGFDGVEIHGANGYLIDQFLRDGTNRRTDRYGGSVENRARFLLETIEAVSNVFGSGRVGVRLSPSGTFNDMADSDPNRTFGYVAGKLNDCDLAYLHIVDALEGDIRHGADVVDKALLRDAYRGMLLINGGYDKKRANTVIEEGVADAVAFGQAFLANPDLPKRFAIDAALNEADPNTFYAGGEKGYIDYPALK